MYHSEYFDWTIEKSLESLNPLNDGDDDDDDDGDDGTLNGLGQS